MNSKSRISIKSDAAGTWTFYLFFIWTNLTTSINYYNKNIWKSGGTFFYFTVYDPIPRFFIISELGSWAKKLSIKLHFVTNRRAKNRVVHIAHNFPFLKKLLLIVRLKLQFLFSGRENYGNLSCFEYLSEKLGHYVNFEMFQNILIGSEFRSCQAILRPKQVMSWKTINVSIYLYKQK